MRSGPLENLRAIGLLSNTGPDPLEIHKSTKAAFNVGSLSACKRLGIEKAKRTILKRAGLIVISPHVPTIFI